MSDAEETAKAVQEASKAAGKAVDAVSNAGGFLAEFIRAPLRELSETWTDNLAYRKWENRQRLKVKAFQKMRELGSSTAWQAIPLRVGLPLLEAAEVAEEDELQERWANLLLNFANEKSGVQPQVAFVSILRELSPFDAAILDKIYSLPAGEGGGIVTTYLPEAVARENPVSNPVTPPPAVPFDVQLSLGNLLRLGCISPSTVWDGGEVLDVVYESVLGRAFHTACTLQTSPRCP